MPIQSLQRVRTRRVLCNLAVGLFVFVSPTYSDAAPVTFRFDATITNVFEAAPFDLPIQYEIGDVIHAKMTFEPLATTTLLDSTVATVQFFKFNFDINGTAVGTSRYGLKILDNGAILDTPWAGDPVFDIFTAGSSINPDFPLPLPDTISIPGGDPFGLSLHLELIGNTATVDAGEIVLSQHQINDFSLRRTLSLGFDASGPGSMGLQATVGTFAIVPEPTSTLMFAFGLSSLLAFRRLLPHAA
jgi:hypothetical protein